jgi:hypothetical protein
MRSCRLPRGQCEHLSAPFTWTGIEIARPRIPAGAVAGPIPAGISDAPRIAGAPRWRSRADLTGLEPTDRRRRLRGTGCLSALWSAN